MMRDGPEKTPRSFASRLVLKLECDQIECGIRSVRPRVLKFRGLTASTMLATVAGETDHESNLENNNHKFADAECNCHHKRSNDREEIADDRGREESYCGCGCLRKEEQRAGRSYRSGR